MEYNFAQFLKDSRKHCKTKEDFILKISKEIDMVVERLDDPKFYVDKKSYLKRLYGATFAAITKRIKEPDKYNEELIKLLDCLK